MKEKNIPNGEYCRECKYKRYKIEKNFGKYGGYEGESIVPYCSLYNCVLSLGWHTIYPLRKCFQCQEKMETPNENV